MCLNGHAGLRDERSQPLLSVYSSHLAAGVSLASAVLFRSVSMADHHSLKLTTEMRGIIVERLALGDMLKDICDDIGVNRSNVYRMTQRNKEFGELYDRAHLTGIEAFLEEARATLATAANRDEILRAKELLRHAEWRAEKLLIRYQPTQKSEVKHSGPMIIGWETEAVTEPAKIISDAELDDMTSEGIPN